MAGAASSHHALNWFFATLGTLVNPNSCDLVVLNGRLDLENLRAAISATLSRHPILCRPLDPLRTSAAVLPIDLRHHRLFEEDAARIDEYLLRLIWDEPFSDGERPIRFHVVETGDKTYFQTIHTHVYADATACYTITEQIAAAYSGLSAPAQERRIPDEDPIERISKPLSLRKQLRRRVQGIAQTARDLSVPFAGLQTARRSVAGRRRLARFVLGADETRRLREAGRSRGHSIHAFFQLAFLRAAATFNQRHGANRSALRMWDFFSLRPSLEAVGSAYDCLALIYPVDLDTRWSDARVLSRCTQYVEQMRLGALLVHAQRFAACAQTFAKSPRAFRSLWPAIFKSNVFFTNPGICPSSLLNFGDLAVVDYITFPQLFFPADVMFIFSTFRDRLRILTLYDHDAFAETFHDELFAPFLVHLGKLANLDFGMLKTRDGFAASWQDQPSQRVTSSSQHSAHEP